jgi:preprotein translocase subunit SecY
VGRPLSISQAGVTVLASLKNVFKVPELRNKVLFTLAVIAIYRFGAYLPVPGIDLDQVKRLTETAQSGGVLAFLQLFSGGALSRFSLFALGIMPYITSSIIMQILAVVIPKLEQWRAGQWARGILKWAAASPSPSPLGDQPRLVSTTVAAASGTSRTA